MEETELPIDEERALTLEQLRSFAEAQLADTGEACLVLSRRQFDWVPAPERHRPGHSLPWLKEWPLACGVALVTTDEPPRSALG